MLRACYSRVDGFTSLAVLIGVLLPALNKARQAAQTAACLSNVRQMVIAANLFANDHKGYMQTWLVHNRNPFRLWRELGTRDFWSWAIWNGLVR